MKTLAEVKQQYPTLNGFGFGHPEGPPLAEEAKQIELAAQWLLDTQRKTKVSQHSPTNNIPKTAFEYSTGAYVPRGGMMAALIMTGFDFVQFGDSAKVGVSQRTLSLAEQTGGIPLAELNKGPYQMLLDAGYSFDLINVWESHDREKKLVLMKDGTPVVNMFGPRGVYVGRKGPKSLEQFRAEAASYGAQTIVGKQLAEWQEQYLFGERAYLRYCKSCQPLKG